MNSPHEPQFAWFLWSMFLIVIWGVIYAFLKNKESRKEMLVVSLWTSLLGLSEPLFVPAYWNPPSLFDLAHRTGFDIESFIFSFGIGGIAFFIYSAIIAMIIGGFFSWYCRPDLKKKMIVSAFIFTAIYFIYFLVLIMLYPGYVERVWNLNAISGVLIFGIPFEELMFAFSFGFLWSSIYEHIKWKRLA